MKSAIFLSILSVSVGMTAFGAPLTPGGALKRLDNSGKKNIISKKFNPRYITAINDSEGEAAIYLYTYSGNEGFLLLSADDAVKPLLGYSETNGFSLENMPESIESWLSLYTEQISASRGNKPYVEVETRAGSYAAISPKLTTKWDQGSPYNNLCPLQNGRRCVTGCVATAMAQVMNYWKYPLVGKGSVSYRPEGLGEELSMDFSTTEFDWDNMLDKYDSKSSAIARKAVATLMKACGYSVKMEYGSGSSGALSRDVSAAFTNYFGYDQGVSRKERSDYASQEEWDRLVYNELANVGPVLYSGQSNSGGHAFVCDGYDGNGLFHINWGWGGMSNGYFELNELTPSDIGTGGHYGGYNMLQQIVTGVMPPVGRLIVDDITIVNAADDSGNVTGWGYTYRINDFSNIQLAVKFKIRGGHVYSPLYVTVFEIDPVTSKNLGTVLDTTFSKPLDESDGDYTLTTRINLGGVNYSKLYSVTVAYELKGQKTTIGNLRLAASSAVDEIFGDESSFDIVREGELLKIKSQEPATLSVYDLSGALVAESKGLSPVLSVGSLKNGVYVAKATLSTGEMKVLKLQLK